MIPNDILDDGHLVDMATATVTPTTTPIEKVVAAAHAVVAETEVNTPTAVAAPTTAEVMAVVAEEKKYVKKDFTSIDGLDESPTILERCIEVLESQQAEFPDLIHLIKIFKAQEKTLLGELAAYRKDHKMLFVIFIHELLLPNPSQSSLAIRAKLSTEAFDFASEDVVVEYFTQVLLPHFKACAAFYDIEKAKEDAVKIVDSLAAMADAGADDNLTDRGKINDVVITEESPTTH